MARMYPVLSEAELRDLQRGEVEFYRLCRDNTPADWLVICRTNLIGMYRGRRASGEADFVVLVPNLGLLVVEVKDGRPSRDANGRYYTFEGKRKTWDPFEQATKEMHLLQDYLRAEHKRRSARGDWEWKSVHLDALKHGRGVFVLQGGNLDDFVGPGSPRAIMGGDNDRHHLAGWVRSVLDYWGKGHHTTPLTPRAMSAIERLICGPLELWLPLRHRLEAEDRRRIELTKEQYRVFRGLAGCRHAAIYGGAGTGKTVLAFERARELAQAGAKTLLLCFNELLSDYLRTCYQADPEPNLLVGHFHPFCMSYCAEVRKRTGRDYKAEAERRYPSVNEKTEWDVQWPDALLLAAKDGGVRFDAVIVDEGQDFSRESWRALRSLLRGDDSYLYVFYDNNQIFYQDEGAIQKVVQTGYHLTFNCRNTKSIHEFAYQDRLYRGVPTDPPSGIDGDAEPFELHASNGNHADLIHEEVVRLLREVPAHRISVLVTEGGQEDKYNQLLSRTLPKGVRYERRGAWADPNVRLDTVKRFKGLESDAVLLWLPDRIDLEAHRELLYVGMTRAKSRLILVGAKEACEYIRPK